MPKPFKSEPITVRIETSKLAQIDKLAEQHNLSRSAFINQCIDYAVDHMPQPDA